MKGLWEGDAQKGHGSQQRQRKTREAGLMLREEGEQKYEEQEVRPQHFLGVFEAKVKGDYRPTTPRLEDYSIKLLSHSIDACMN